MVNKKVLEYTQKSIESGYTSQQIGMELFKQGWSESEINEALVKAYEIIRQRSTSSTILPEAPKKSEWDLELKDLSASQILLSLGGIIVVVAGIIYAGINWTQWGSIARILAILIPMIICYTAGTFLFSNKPHKAQGVILIMIGSLLFPFLLSVMFDELQIITSFNNRYFVISLLSLFIYHAMGELAEAPLFIDDTPGLSLAEIRTKARRLQLEHGLKLVVVDYLQLVRGSGRYNDNRVQEVSEISQGLKNLARELKIPVIAVSQLSRQVENRGSRKPQLADLRESGAIEQDADVVMFIYREDPDNIEDVTLDIQKHRNGPTGEIKLIFKGDKIKFYGLEKTRSAAKQKEITEKPV